MAKLSQDALFGSRVNPATGQYYSASELKRAFLGGRRRRVSSSVFGRRGGALAVRPQQTVFDQQQDVLIQSNTTSVNSLQEQINNLRSSLFSINSGLQNIYQLLLLETTQERNQLLAQQAASRRITESEFRQGQEDVLERKIRSAIQAPLQKVQKKVGGILGRIGQALGMLLLGWLTNQGIEALKANAEGDANRLEEIKNNIKDKLIKAVAIVAGLHLGFKLLLKGLVGLGKAIVKLGVKIVKLPFQLLGGGIRALFGFGKKTPDLGKATGIKSAPRGSFSRAMGGVQFGKFRPGKGNILLAGLGAGFSFYDRKQQGQTNLQAAVGAGAETIGGITGFYGASKAAGIALSPLLLAPFPGARPLYAGLVFGAGILGSLGLSSLAGKAADELTGVEGVKPIEQIDASKVQFSQQAFQPLPQLMDAPPTITTIDLPGVTQPAPAASGSQETLTDIPLIKSSNDENIYTMNSMSLYNVAFE